jgi:hypothetical protein
MTTQRYIAMGVISGQPYEVRVRAVAGLVRSPYTSTTTALGAPDITPPGVPVSLRATGVIRGVSLTWVNAPDPDLKWTEVWEGASEGGPFSQIAQVGGTAYVRTGLAPGDVAWFRVRAVDHSGNASPFSDVVRGAASLLLANDIQDGILDTAKFASAVRPVEFGGALPTTGNFEGRLFYLTTDETIYKFVDGVWVDEENGQPIGFPSIIAGRIRAAAITSTEIAAGEVRAVNLASETLITQAAQIGNGVIINAKIGDAQITSAKIGNLEVDTIKINSNAVTEFAHAGWVGDFGSGTETEILTIFCGNASFGGTLVISGSMNGIGSTAVGEQGYRLMIRINGALVYDYQAPFGSLVYLNAITVGPGLTEIKLNGRTYGPSGGRIRQASIRAELLKR